jgi:ABC-type multidrug transport system fused ATPase/permease subunit
MEKRLSRKFLPWLVAQGVEFWPYYLGATVCLFFLHQFQSWVPELAKNLGDLIGEGRIAEVNVANFFYVAVAILTFRTLSRLLFFYPARIQQKLLRNELLGLIENAHPEQYQKYNDGDLFQTLYNDFNRLRGFVGFALLQLGNIIIAMYVFVPKIVDFNSKLLIAFLPLFIGVLIFTTLIYFFQPYAKKSMDQMAQVQNTIIESYEGKTTIKNFHQESSFIKLFQEKSMQELRYFYIESMGRTISQPMIKLGVGASLIWGAWIIRAENMEATSLIYFSGFLYLVLEPLVLLSWIGVVSVQGYAGWKRVKGMYHDLVTPLERKFDEIRLWDKVVEMDVAEKSWTVIIGDTGCGKSTLLKNYADKLRREGKKVSLVSQEPYLYNDTVMDNIFLNNPRTEYQMEKCRQYIKLFGLDVLGFSVDEVLNLEVGENGKKVSGGQAKRIALLRSLVCDVDYILWDDPFSSLDFILERQILIELKKDLDLKEKTFLLTTHRISTVKFCDSVIFLDQDCGVRESGFTKELFNQESAVAKYFKKQMV